MAEGLYVYTHINTNASQQQVSANASSVLGAVNVNTAGASGNTLTIFDAATTADCTAANTIAVITTTTVQFLGYDCQVKRGIFYTLATGTAADITISFR